MPIHIGLPVSRLRATLTRTTANASQHQQPRPVSVQVVLAKPIDVWRGKHFATTRKNDMRLAKRIRPIGFKDGAKIGIILEPCSTRRHLYGIFSVFLFRGLYVAHFVHREICFCLRNKVKEALCCLLQMRPICLQTRPVA